MATDSIKRLIELGINATPAMRELAKLGDETAKQTKQLDGLQATLNNFGSSIKGAFAGLGVSEAVSQVVTGIRSMIDEMDALNDQSANLGTTANNLRELQFAFSMSGMKSEDATAALTRLSDKLEQVGDESSNTGRILRELGVTAGDDASSAIDKIADAFSRSSDPIAKTAIAVELFGKQLGPRMVGMLNDGAEGLQALREEFRLLGGTIEDDTIKQAAEFNDNLDKLAVASSSLGRSIVATLLPALVELTTRFAEAAKEGNLFSTALDRYWENVEDFWTKVGRKFVKGGKETNAELREQAKAWDDLTESMRKQAVQDFKLSQGEVTLPKTTAPPKEPKVRTGGASRAVKEAKTDLEAWWDSLLKVQQSIDDTPEKIAKLESELAILNARGEGASEWAKKLQAELAKLDPSPVAQALAKIREEADKLAAQPALVAGLTKALLDMEAAGDGATQQARLLREEIMKLESAVSPVAAVALELDKMRKTVKENTDREEEWQRLLATGQINVAEYSKGIAKYYDDLHQQQDKTLEKTKDLGEAIKEAGAGFVTDFVDELIDGFGKTEASFEDMIESMLKQLAKLVVQMQIAKAFTAMGIGTKAQGAAWDAQGVEYMASGGILSSPTFFNNRGRLAVAGEAGPEAVIPLQRNAAGDLGVSAAPVTVNVHNNAPVEVATRNKDNEDGSRQIDIYIEQRVKQLMTNGTMDRTMRTTYGLSRQPAMG